MVTNLHDVGNDPGKLLRLIGVAAPEPQTNELERLRTENVRLRTENVRLQNDNAALVKLITNPHLKEASKIVAVRLAVTARSKASHNQDMDDAGRVRVSASEIAEDHRRRPEPGERLAAVNPDGRPFLMPRSSVKGILAELRDTHRVLDFNETKVRKVRAANNLPYTDTEYLVTPGASLADTLKAVAWFTPATPTIRPYTRQAPCIHCGEVHARTVVCDGCGGVIRTIPVPLEQDPSAHVDAGQDEPTMDTPPIATNYRAMSAVENSFATNYRAMDTPPIATNYRAMSAVENSFATNYRAMDHRPPMHQPPSVHGARGKGVGGAYRLPSPSTNPPNSTNANNTPNTPNTQSDMPLSVSGVEDENGANPRTKHTRVSGVRGKGEAGDDHYTH